MTSRERVVATLQHREPDRVPMDLGSTNVTSINQVAYRNLCQKLGIGCDEIRLLDYLTKVAVVDEPVRQRLGVDCVNVRTRPPGYYQMREWREGSSTYLVDEYGTVRAMPDDGHWFDPVGFPLAGLGLEDLAHYRWPDPYDPARIKGVGEEARALFEGTDYAIVAMPPTLVLTRAQQMRGFDQFLVDLIAEPRLAEAILDRIAEYNAIVGERFMQEVGGYVQVVMAADDLGTQAAMMLSPDLYRKMIKPRHAEWIKALKRHTNARVFFHSDGSVYPVIPDLIEIGVDILNPVQGNAAQMDPARLKREFGRELSFWGSVDTQEVMPRGTPRDVEQEVRQRIEQLAAGGGFVLAPVHNILGEVPAENVVALYETGREYGRY